MANLILPRRFSRPPQHAVEVDWSNPLTRGLVFASLAGTGAVFDATRGALTPSGTVVQRTASKFGIDDKRNWLTTTGGSYSILAKNRVFSAGSGTRSWFTSRAVYASSGIYHYVNSSGNYVFEHWNGSVSSRNSALGRGDGDEVLVSYDGSTLNFSLWSAGATKYTYSNTLSAYGTSGSGASALSADGGQSVGAAWFFVWNRVLADEDADALRKDPWQIFRREPQVLYFDVGSGTTLTPPLVTDADTFHAATVTTGTVTLTPSLVTDSDTFHAATVSQGGVTQDLTPALFSDGDTFHAGTVAPGAVNLTPALYADADTFHSAEVAAGYNLAPAAFEDGDTFHAATVTPGVVVLAPGLYSDADTFYAPTVALAGGAQTLTPALFADGDTFHAATVATGAVSLTPALYADADTFHAAEVAAGYNLAPAAFEDGDTFHAATVTPGVVVLAPGLYSDADTFYAPTVALAGGGQTLTPALFADGDTFYAATVASVDMTVDLLTAPARDTLRTAVARTIIITAPSRTFLIESRHVIHG